MKRNVSRWFAGFIYLSSEEILSNYTSMRTLLSKCTNSTSLSCSIVIIVSSSYILFLYTLYAVACCGNWQEQQKQLYVSKWSHEPELRAYSAVLSKKFHNKQRFVGQLLFSSYYDVFIQSSIKTFASQFSLIISWIIFLRLTVEWQFCNHTFHWRLMDYLTYWLGPMTTAYPS